MIKKILLKCIIGTILLSSYIYAQECSDGFTYFENIPENINNINNDSNCFFDEDIAVLINFISINELNYDSPLGVGPQTWATGRLKIWVATYIPSGSNGITQKIDQLPNNIGQLSELTTLYLEKHDLIELPESFIFLSELVILAISNNWLISLPEDFGNLTSLGTLDLGYNQIESIPESIGDLINIEYLFLFNNQLTSLPETICDLDLDWNGISPANYPYFACGGNYLCDSELIPDCVEYSANFNISMEQNYYSFLLDSPQGYTCPNLTEPTEVCNIGNSVSCYNNTWEDCPVNDECGICDGDGIDEGTCDCDDNVLGDLNDDGGWNVLDIVNLANCILTGNCTELGIGCSGDMNGDGGYNVLDIVNLANCVLANNCSD